MIMRSRAGVTGVVVGLCVAGVLTGCGGSDGTAPALSGLAMKTDPVVREQIAQAEVTASDPNGLEGLVLNLRFGGAASLTTSTPASGVTSELKSSLILFGFVLNSAAPTGSYTLAVTATDGTGLTGNEVATTFTVSK
jgi:hypothetical protein